ncbi:MAG TPA: hypothetical protein VF026_06870 [Ktedonobacteraceae bacterium]
MQRAGDRAADVVRDAESIEHLDQRGEGLDHIVVQGHRWEIPFSATQFWTP